MCVCVCVCVCVYFRAYVWTKLKIKFSSIVDGVLMIVKKRKRVQMISILVRILFILINFPTYNYNFLTFW